MKTNRAIFFCFLLMVIVAAVYRLIPYPTRPINFAPQLAMALFAGAVIKDKRLAFLVPLLSMFISDSIYQILYINGLTEISGFYEGQWQNYLLFVLMTVIGFFIRKINVPNVLAGALAAPVVFFILSNFVVWAGWQGTRGLGRPKTFQGLMLCYNDALPFFWNSVASCILFSALFFGAYVLMVRKQPVVARA